MTLGEWAKARDDLEHVLESAPHHHQALTQLASCFMSLERPERAEQPLNEAIRLQPNYAAAWFQRGMLYLEIGRNDNALDDFQAAVRCDGSHLESQKRIAAIHHQAERFDLAEPAWRAVLALDPESDVAPTRIAICEAALLKA
jgi:Tfp pilus assembly protein PilF